MKNIKKGKEEIIYLLSKVLEKYKSETGIQIIQNTNRKNYESLAILLSDISKELPNKSEEWGNEKYSQDLSPNTKDYPYRKYDITGGQIKDALNGIVSNPRPFLVDACYVYLFGMGRKRFAENPVDDKLIEQSNSNEKNTIGGVEEDSLELKNQLSKSKNRNKKKSILIILGIILLISISFYTVYLYSQSTKLSAEWSILKKDMNILPYQPTKNEIDSLSGVWICYTGSPQARVSDPNRFHKIVPNILSVEYKNGYFLFNRYGASFDHIGYMQFESPGIVSIHSRVKNNADVTESPRHSLMNIFDDSQYLTAISSSWNFDVGNKNKIIGIREVYQKLGSGGSLKEVINEVENASCQCKIIRWQKENGELKSYYLKNEILDSLKLPEMQSLIDEKSILLMKPQQGIILSKDTLLQN